jgi:hypothetical protein
MVLDSGRVLHTGDYVARASVSSMACDELENPTQTQATADD